MPLRQTAPTKLRLAQISFGKLDARYEVLTRDEKDREHFRDSFLEPSGLSLGEFIKGDRYFVHGMKGSGKTALLRYLQLHAEDSGCITKFISFASDISEAERARLAAKSGIEILNQDDIDVEVSAIDFWILFIFRALVRIVEENKKVFSVHQDINSLCGIVKQVYDGGTDSSGLKWLSKALKSGKYKLRAKYIEASVKGGAENEVDYPIDVIVSKCCSLIKSLSFEGPSRINLFFDELNLALSSRSQHKRDAVLIRDLVLAVDRLNTLFVEESKPIYLIAAIRSEVLNTMNAPTHEINKMLTDRGRELRWFARTAGHVAPIIDLVERKIMASEKAVLPKNNCRSGNMVWRDYFHGNLFSMSPQEFVVTTTWCNPRDLVMLLGRAASEATNDSIFAENNIYRVLEQYSADAWREKTEELNVEYAQTEIQTIKKLLVNFKQYFRSSELEIEADRRSKLDQNIQQLVRKRKLEKVLDDLYRVGIIGQSSRAPNYEKSLRAELTEHWAYRGDQNFDPKTWMIVHRALWPELRLGRIRPNQGG